MKHIIRTVALTLIVSMLSVNAFAAEKFTPSVEQKKAPVVANQKNEQIVDGKPAIVVKNEKGEVQKADAPVVLKITPVSSVKKAEDNKDDDATEATETLTEEEEEIQESLEEAFEQIAGAESLEEIAPELPDVLKALKIETPVEELVVQDLVNISLPEEMTEALEEEGNTIDITFEMKVEEGKQLIVLVQNEDGEWIVISGDAIVVDDDGTVTISFPCVGNVAFIMA